MAILAALTPVRVEVWNPYGPRHGPLVPERRSTQESPALRTHPRNIFDNISSRQGQTDGPRPELTEQTSIT